MGHISGLCDTDNAQRFTCAGAKVMYNASLIWGTIGPQRMFQSGQVYHSLMYFFLIGVCSTCSSYVVYLLIEIARGDGDCVPDLPTLSAELGQICQRTHFLQCCRKHPSC